MTATVIWASIHYIGILLLFAFLMAETLLWRSGIDGPTMRRLLKLDAGVGLAALAVLISGVARAGWTEKGWAFYAANPWFHAKVSLFVLVALLSLYPTVTFLRWRRTLAGGGVPPVDERQFQRVRRVLGAELHLMLLIPILAVLMARGVGMGG
jgi:putative membrane protein